jgi:hypothetical protein
VEEVDSGKELRFRSNDELLKFLGECFDAVLAMELDRGTTRSTPFTDGDQN